MVQRIAESTTCLDDHLKAIRKELRLPGLQFVTVAGIEVGFFFIRQGHCSLV